MPPGTRFSEGQNSAHLKALARVNSGTLAFRTGPGRSSSEHPGQGLSCANLPEWLVNVTHVGVQGVCESAG